MIVEIDYKRKKFHIMANLGVNDDSLEGARSVRKEKEEEEKII